MSTDQVITLATAIGGALTALAALLTVFEMKRQRRSTYRPDLLLRGARFDVYDRHPAGLSRFTLTTEPSIPLGESMLLHAARCDVYNAGFGPARHITVRWSFSVEQFRNLIKDGLPEGIIQINERGELLDLRGPKGEAIEHRLSTQFVARVLVVPPQTTERLMIPAAYTDLVARYVGARSVTPGSGSVEHGPIPSINLVLEYEDLERAQTTVRFAVHTQFEVLRYFGDDGPPASLAVAEGYFEIREA